MASTARSLVNEGLEKLAAVQKELSHCSPNSSEAVSFDPAKAAECVGAAMQALQDATRALQPQDLDTPSMPATVPNDVGILLGNIQEFTSAIVALEASPLQADEAGVREATRKGVASMTNLGDPAILEAAECDVSSKKPLQALLDLRERGGQYKDDPSDLGDVMRTLTESVDGVIKTFGGEGEVAFKREDELMLAHIKTYIDDVMEELERKHASADLHSAELNRQEEELVGKIKAVSQELNKQTCRNRGALQRQRIEHMQSLVDFYAKKVTTVTAHNESYEFLGTKQEEMKDCFDQEHKNYETMQKCHDEFAEMLRAQRKRLNDFVGNKEKQHKREAKLCTFRKLALKYLQRHHARCASESLQILLLTSAELSQAGVLEEEKRIAFEEAMHLSEETFPRLDEAEKKHELASVRSKSAAELLASFARCIDSTHHGLKAKAKRDMKSVEHEVPKYGARCIEARGALRADVETMKTKLDDLGQKCRDDIKRLNERLERLEMLSQSDDQYDQKAKELDECKEHLADFEKQRKELDKLLDMSDCEGVRLAEEAAQGVDQATAEETQAWLDGFHFGGSRRPALPAVDEERAVQFGGARPVDSADVVEIASAWSEVVPLSGDDDSCTVFTADNFDVIEETTASTQSGGITDRSLEHSASGMSSLGSPAA